MEYSEVVAKEWLKQCYEEAVHSPDPSTQIGSAIVVGYQLQKNTLSFNGPTAGWEMTEEQWNHKPTKYQLVEHAERRAIYTAAKNGLWLEGATLVSTWAACADCARAIAEVGIRTLIRHYPPLDDATERWLESVSIGDQILKANGVKIIDVIGNIEGAPGILRSGEKFYPSRNRRSLYPGYLETENTLTEEEATELKEKWESEGIMFSEGGPNVAD